MIRAMRPSDALAIGLSRSGRWGDELTARTWPRTPPENRRPSLLGLLAQTTLPTPSLRHIGVATQSGRRAGFIVLSTRAGGLAWDVEHLSAEGEEAAVGLLRWGAEKAIAARARRVFLDTPSEGQAADVAWRAGFQRYTEGATYQLDPGFDRGQADALPARPRLRSDDAPLFHLYNTVVPANVRAAEAMTQEEWSALHPGRKPWSPAIVGARREDYVWEIGSQVAGWMRLIFGDRSQSLDILVRPNYESFGDRMVRYALGQLSAKVPVLVDVREYLAGTIGALERAGFRRGEAYAVWVRQLAERVPERAMGAVTAQASPTA